jgi:hypothetical protein
MARYFENFNTAQYNDEICRNITHRAGITRDVMNRTSVFYPYQTKEGERPDTLSHLYYEDSMMEWLVFFANGIIDPYYGWYLSGDQFNQYIISKYGSLAEAQLKTHHYQVNWVGDDTKLTISAYEGLQSVAPINLKRYWAPVLNEYGSVVFYQRAQLDLTVTTNRITQFTVASSAGFEVGELVSQLSGDTVVGYGEIVALDTGSIVIKNVNGLFGAGVAITGFSSGTQATPITVTVLTENIPTVEQIYWRSVSIYDFEELLNEQRKTVKLIDKRYAEQAQLNLQAVMG